MSLPVRHARTSLQRLMHNNGPDIVSAETCYAWRAAGAKVLVTSGQLRPALAIQVPACPSTKTAPLAARQCSTQAGSYFGGQDLLFVPRRPYARSGRTVSALVGQPSFACAQGQGAGYAAGHGGSIKQTDMTWQPCLLARHFLGLLPAQQDAQTRSLQSRSTWRPCPDARLAARATALAAKRTASNIWQAQPPPLRLYFRHPKIARQPGRTCMQQQNSKPHLSRAPRSRPARAADMH